MKRFWVMPLTALLATGFFLFNCEDVDKTKIVLATVDGKNITAAQMDSIAAERKPVIRKETDLDSLKQALMDSLVDLRLVDVRIDSVGNELEKDRKFLNRRREELAGTILRLMYQGEISGNVDITDEDILKEYEDNKSVYVMPAQVKASHILVKVPPPDSIRNDKLELMEQIKEKNTAEARKRAQAVYDKAIAGENWDSLCVKYSQDPVNSAKGGNLGYFSRGQMVAPFDSAAFAADSGAIIGPVETIHGFHIIKIDDVNLEQQLELDDKLKSDIEKKLRSIREKAKADAYVDSLKAQAQYMYNEEALAKADSLVEDDEWVMIVDETDTVFEDVLKSNFYKYLRRIGKKDWEPQDKKDFLEEIAVNSLLRAAGKRLGYYEKPKAIEAKESITRREAGIKVKNMLRDLDYQPSQEEVEKYYNDNFDAYYKVDKPLHVQHIIFNDMQLAHIVRDSIVAGASFKEMALKYYPGEKEIREVAYDLGFISDEELGQEFFDQANKLKEKEVSQPFRTEWGTHVVKLIERRTDKKLDQVRPGIRRSLIDARDKAKKGEFLDEWRKLADIKIDQAKLKLYEFDEELKAIEITPEG